MRDCITDMLVDLGPVECQHGEGTAENGGKAPKVLMVAFLLPSPAGEVSTWLWGTRGKCRTLMGAVFGFSVPLGELHAEHVRVMLGVCANGRSFWGWNIHLLCRAKGAALPQKAPS